VFVPKLTICVEYSFQPAIMPKNKKTLSFSDSVFDGTAYMGTP